MNLLLEGDDLEALLIRAHQEGGSSSRIVIAQKIRRGGFLGFFAREGFEVAVEIPADEARVEEGPPRSLPGIEGLRGALAGVRDRPAAAGVQRRSPGLAGPAALEAADRAIAAAQGV